MLLELGLQEKQKAHTQKNTAAGVGPHAGQSNSFLKAALITDPFFLLKLGFMSYT